MKRKDLITIISAALLAGLISLIMAKIVFKSSAHHTPVPVAAPLTSNFPDVSNDPFYKTVFNNQALDPAQPIQIGNAQNSQPFGN